MATKILLIAHQYWPTPGSATQRLGAMVGALVERFDVEVTVLSAGAPQGLIRTGQYGETVRFVAGPEARGRGVARVMGLYRFGRAIRQGMRGIEFDLVISDPPPTAAYIAGRVASRAGKPFVYYLSDSWAAALSDSRGLGARATRCVVGLLERAALVSADLVVAVTPKMREVATIAGSRRVLLAPNGVDTGSFSSTGRDWRPSAGQRPFLLYAGNAGVVHGAHLFAQAANKLWDAGFDFDLVYMGNDGSRFAPESIRSRRPDRLYLLPSQDPETVAAAFRAAAGALSAVRPIPGYTDAVPIKTISGLACGAPAVYLGSGPFANDLRQSRAGFVADWSIGGALSVMKSALHEVRTDYQAHLQRRCRARDFATEEFDIRKTMRTVVDEMTDLMSGS